MPYMNKLRKKAVYLACIVAPHIMLPIGLYILLKDQNQENRASALNICKMSAIALIAGSIIYYMIFTPFLDLF